MRAVVYVDEIAFVDFWINLYILMLINNYFYNKISRIKIVLIALLMSILLMVSFCSFRSALLNWIFEMMSIFLFAVHIVGKNSYEGYFEFFKSLLVNTLLVGGGFSFTYFYLKLLNVPINRSISACATAGILTFAILLWGRKKDSEAWVILGRGNKEVKLRAIIDTGCSLIEPISGRPVIVIGEKYKYIVRDYKSLRAIPFSAVGKEHGIMYGYLEENLKIRVRGVDKECKKIYVAVCQEYFEDGKIEAIVNPIVLQR